MERFKSVGYLERTIIMRRHRQVGEKVTTAIATCNRIVLVEQCINAILVQSGASCDIIVIDNGGTDGTEELGS